MLLIDEQRVHESHDILANLLQLPSARSGEKQVPV